MSSRWQCGVVVLSFAALAGGCRKNPAGDGPYASEVGDAVPRHRAQRLRDHHAGAHLEHRGIGGDHAVGEALEEGPQPHGRADDEGRRRAREGAAVRKVLSSRRGSSR